MKYWIILYIKIAKYLLKLSLRYYFEIDDKIVYYEIRKISY